MLYLENSEDSPITITMVLLPLSSLPVIASLKSGIIDVSE